MSRGGLGRGVRVGERERGAGGRGGTFFGCEADCGFRGRGGGGGSGSGHCGGMVEVRGNW